MATTTYIKKQLESNGELIYPYNDVSAVMYKYPAAFGSVAKDAVKPIKDVIDYCVNNKTNLDSLVTNKDNIIPNTVTVTGTTPTIAVAKNTVYNLTNTITTLTISSIETSNLESVLYFKTGANFRLILPTCNIVGTLSFDANKSYVMSILNGIVISKVYEDFTGREV